MKNSIISMALFMVLTGCSTVSKVGMISNGNLEGKTFQGAQKGNLVKGEACGYSHSLADAFDRTIANSQYDTIIDVEIESTTDLFVFGNCIKLKGYGVNSIDLADGE